MLVLFLCALFACSKVEVYQTVNSEDFQVALCSEITNRYQLTSVTRQRNSVGLTFRGKKEFKIDCSQLSFWETSPDDVWIYNGENTGKKVSRDEHGYLIATQISLGSDMMWRINGSVTSERINNRFYSSVSKMKNAVYFVVFDQDTVYFYSIDGEIKRVPVVQDEHLWVPSYYSGLVLQKELRAEQLLQDAGNSASCFVFFTDAHWGSNEKHSPSLVKHILDYTSIDKVFFGGDAITNYFSNPDDAISLGQEFMQSFSFIGNRFYCVVGNHDDNATGQPKEYANHLSDEQVYSYLQSQMADVVYGPYLNYYLDEDSTQTRYICLDTGRLFLEAKRTNTIQTASFLISALSSLPKGWHVVAISHIWTNLVDIETGECKESKYIKPLIDILKVFNDRESGYFSYKNEKIPYDFSESTGRVEFCLGGHTHADYVVDSEDGIPLITLTCDGRIQVAGEPSVKGTVSEQCVAIVITDYRHRQLHILHIGRGDDVTLSF